MHDEGQRQLCRLLYSSRSALPGDAGSHEDSVRKLAASAAERNRVDELTGSLLYVDNMFIQVLEGPSQSVEAAFERICCDFRHGEVKLYDVAPAGDRLFGDWTMACLTEQQATAVGLREEMQEVRFLAGVNAREAVQQMRALVRRAA